MEKTDPLYTNEFDLLYTAFNVIANVSEGNWDKQSDEWQNAAIDFRDRWHSLLDELQGRHDERNSSNV